jgi:hypothetical protein
MSGLQIFSPESEFESLAARGLSRAAEVVVSRDKTHEPEIDF